MTRVGFVSIVGAGPGDPDLWTVRAARRIAEADIVYYDALIDGLALTQRTTARCFRVGKRAGEKGVCQDTVNQLLVRTARRGKQVVRLKGGDPFVFGRGAEEAISLVAAGVPFEVIPGVSSALAAPALAGIPVTHRGTASGVLVVSGHHPSVMESILDGVRPNRLTVIVLMGMHHRLEIVEFLLARGWEAATLTAIIAAAGCEEQVVWTGPLEKLATIETSELPGVIVIGDVVGVRDMVTAVAVETEHMEIQHGR